MHSFFQCRLHVKLYYFYPTTSVSVSAHQSVYDRHSPRSANHAFSFVQHTSSQTSLPDGDPLRGGLCRRLAIVRDRLTGRGVNVCELSEPTAAREGSRGAKEWELSRERLKNIFASDSDKVELIVLNRRDRDPLRVGIDDEPHFMFRYEGMWSTKHVFILEKLIWCKHWSVLTFRKAENKWFNVVSLNDSVTVWKRRPWGCK